MIKIRIDRWTLWIGISLLFLPSVALTEKKKLAHLEGVGWTQHLNQKVPLNLLLTNEEGESTLLKNYLKGRPILLSFIYFECTRLCHFGFNGLIRLLNESAFSPGTHFDILTVSIHPKDSPFIAAQKKSKWMDQLTSPAPSDVNSAWHFLTGDGEATRKLADAVGFGYRFDPQSGHYAHPSGIVLLTPQGVISHYFFGIQFSAKDFEQAVKNASSEKVSSPLEEIFLSCFHFDPTTGKYDWAVMQTLRLFGGLIAFFLCLFFYRLYRKERSA